MILKMQNLPCQECDEPLVTIGSPILCEYRRKDSDVHEVLVRKTIAEKLQKVQNRLEANMQLLVVEGYRSYAYQERYFLEELLKRYDPTIPVEMLIERVHQFVALPSVAGHPTGGAVDLTLAYAGKEVDMGGQIADFSSPDLLPTYSPLASPEQRKNRLLLHDLMVAEGFAPFYGEWWHFSYGDREWAAFYDKPYALYPPSSCR